MDINQNFLNTYWSGQTPFIANLCLQQLRMGITQHDWFKDCDHSTWFDVPSTDLEQLQAEFNNDWMALGQQTLSQQDFTFSDRRFSSENWNNPLFGSLAAFYLLNSKFLLKLLDLLPINDEKSKQRLDYLIEQMIAASAPSNFLMSNPDAIERAVETKGTSLASGFLHLASDMKEGKMRQCDAGEFEVGKTLATTPGAVVFENELFQLIQYKPLTETQFQKPMFIVPPIINKYYILDLQQENSLVRHLLEQGQQVFLISWRNFGQEQAHVSWEQVVQDGIINAIRTTRAISGERQLNCMGFCIGGTLLSCALAVLAARGDTDIASLSLFATFLDYVETGPIDVFVDEKLVAYRERTIGGKDGSKFGLFRGEDMGNSFSMLRPNELWWNYNVDKYLKGEKPRAFDLLFWNNDSTNFPGNMYCWYLRHTYLQNDLKSGELDMCGVKLDFATIKTPTYLLATQDDHIVPWHSAYASTALLKGPTRFVLGSSGHIAGVINPPAKKKRNYWVNDKIVKSPDAWLKAAEQKPGSWWNDWFDWLEKHSGKKVPAVTEMGSAEYPAIEAAPGRYVMQQG